ncbi:malate synthase A [Vibrio sp. S17_S38]|uniref:malate synthase A n=1 Tax=Vibrio sp. S17_S38 TaxID=2720229 RepID=UPI001680C6A0|nr:malate synthase A [Vibrio sp. S17_S38]MBD1574629.1 malate synthase A [Vibrio sp. S17_S38]
MHKTQEREQEAATNQTHAITVIGTLQSAQQQAILSPSAVDFLDALVTKFSAPLDEVMALRRQRQAQFDGGELPDFRSDTQHIRQDKSWKVAPIPAVLQDRRVEITGPVDRKMVINALNSGAKIFMCCFEDASAPTWENMIDGQVNLKDANAGTISYFDEKKGKSYDLVSNPAQLLARPRGLHLPEKHIQYNGKPIAGCLMDFALYFFHNYQTRAQKGDGVYYYIPKLESMEEAKWWDDVFSFTEDYFSVERGTIKATVLIETLPAVFQMEEMLYVMREHIVAMNCGRWDYIFSYIKTLKNHKDRILPDRHSIGMDKPFLNAYSQLLVKTCHARGALAMGGMSAFIPNADPEVMAQVRAKVEDDKDRESSNGHDGGWVAHPKLVEIVMDIFEKKLNGNINQIDYDSSYVGEITAQQLLEPCTGPRNEEGLRKNIRIALYYIEAWIGGVGCVPIYGLMEDAATAEISRAGIWQWIKHGVKLDDGQVVTEAYFRSLLAEELITIKQEVGEQRYAQGRFEETAKMFDTLSTQDDFAEFLTLPSYSLLC